MSKQRNKRNTRRGRAKRWKCPKRWGVGCAGRCAPTRRGGLVVVAPIGVKTPQGSLWLVCFGAASSDMVYPSRAAAMRAAEHIARRK